MLVPWRVILLPSELVNYQKIAHRFEHSILTPIPKGKWCIDPSLGPGPFSGRNKAVDFLLCIDIYMFYIPCMNIIFYILFISHL